MSDAEESYFVRWRGKVEGPYALKEIRELIAQGRLSRLHDLSTDQVTWQQADTFADLYPRYERRVPETVDTPEQGEDESPGSSVDEAIGTWRLKINFGCFKCCGQIPQQDTSIAHKNKYVTG